jgi:tricorn protease
MWIDSRIFFLSDRNGPVTLFSYDTRSRQVTQALRNDGMDFKSASVVRAESSPCPRRRVTPAT